MTQIKIAFAGQMRAGKDTAGEYVQQKYGGVIKKFATPIYDIMHYAQKRTRRPQEKWRKFLQVVGTDLFRADNPNIWVDLLLEEVADLGPAVNSIVTDARFENEFVALQNAGFKLIKIERDAFLRAERMEGGHAVEMETHASEKDVLTYNKFDSLVMNNRSFEDLYKSLDYVIRKHFNDPISIKREQIQHLKAELNEVWRLLDQTAKAEVITIASLRSRAEVITKQIIELISE